jgi:methionine salvage enolase-phosphatase E1
MYNIIINNSINTLGLITFQIRREGDLLIKEGILKTHLYIEEIDTLECDRFKINGVDVFVEAFGSTDIFNLYTFTYEDFEMKDLGENHKEEDLIALYDKELE